MAADYGNLYGTLLTVKSLGDESLRAESIKHGDAEQLALVVYAGLLENLGSDGNHAVDRVGDDGDACLGGILGYGLDQVLDDACVDVEKIIAGHAGLSCNACGHNYNIGALEGL